MLLLFYSLLVPKRMLIYENLYNITKLIKVGNKRTSLVIQGLRLCASCHSPQWLHQFTFPPTVLEGSLFFTSSPACSVCGFFDDGHSDRFEQIPHYSFNLHFSNNEQCWASFHVGVGHLKINSKRKKKEKKSLCALRAGVLARFLVREPRSCCIQLCVDKKQNDRQSKESKGNVKGWKVKRDQEWAFRLQREAPAPSTLCWGQNANLDWHAQPAGGFPGGASGKEPACQSRKHKMAGVGVGFDAWVRETPLKEEMTTHSSILAWRIPWTEEPGGLWSTGSWRVRYHWSNLARALRKLGGNGPMQETLCS